MTLRSLRSTCVLTFGLILLTLQLPALAHTALTSSLPANGQTVTAPAALTLDFNGAVSLLVLSVTSKDGEVEIGFTPRAEPVAHHEVALPTLAPGRYVVDWTIVGADGHRISQSFSFSVE